MGAAQCSHSNWRNRNPKREGVCGAADVDMGAARIAFAAGLFTFPSECFAALDAAAMGGDANFAFAA